MATNQDLVDALNAAQTAVTTDTAAITADQAKLAADQAQETTDAGGVTTAQAAIATAVATAPFFVVNTDGTATVYLTAAAPPAYQAIIVQPASAPGPAPST